ncbi:MAG: HEAT repeat domain-containing protein [Candidatus Electrothrix sp. ATG1]|nr:HEAT repeat domain-containing protein [Candidatus Electrothrix sp. ATG1]
MWERHRDDEARQISHAAYAKAGRTAGILNSYFFGKIGLFSKKEQALASAAFDHLVGTRAVKIAHPLGRLTELARADGKELQAVLDRLQDYAILRRQMRGEEFWYELYHDIFSESIDHWNREFKARQRVKRLVCGSIAVLTVASLMYGGNTFQANYFGRYLQLSPKKSISDQVELYQGDINQKDMFGQRTFLYETAFSRQEIEADRLFSQNMLDDADKARQDLIQHLPMLDRFAFYMRDGIYSDGYELKESILEHDKDEEIVRLVEQLGQIRSEQAVNIIVSLLKHNDDTKIQQAAIRELIILDTQTAVPALIECLKKKNQDVQKSAIGTRIK